VSPRQCAICGAELRPNNPTGCCLECRILAQNDGFDAEVWLPIVGFVGWQISDQGHIRNARTHAIREPDRSHRYPRVCLNGRQRYVHHLMAASWLGPRPWGQLVLHGDDRPQNLHIANLRYGDHAENAADKKRNRATAGKESAGKEQP
jgi:hypothetical protein